MPRICAAINCNNKMKKGNLSFFSFPSNAERRKQWLINIRRADLNVDMTKEQLDKGGYVVCEEHFEKHMIDAMGMRKNLKDGAKPTIINWDSPLIHIYNKRTSPKKKVKTDHQAIILKKKSQSQDNTNNGKILSFGSSESSTRLFAETSSSEPSTPGPSNGKPGLSPEPSASGPSAGLAVTAIIKKRKKIHSQEPKKRKIATSRSAGNLDDFCRLFEEDTAKYFPAAAIACQHVGTIPEEKHSEHLSKIQTCSKMLEEIANTSTAELSRYQLFTHSTGQKMFNHHIKLLLSILSEEEKALSTKV
ncbi:THAP domain-containing protein 3 isoform X2 [Latimeria chalumnae]|uniref:THAP domain-containing protein 3 isoform X2 n=1 Tax=Latimeria chalumnae TaxID=7897 RepID=UPI00313C8377